MKYSSRLYMKMRECRLLVFSFVERKNNDGKIKKFSCRSIVALRLKFLTNKFHRCIAKSILFMEQELYSNANSCLQEEILIFEMQRLIQFRDNKRHSLSNRYLVCINKFPVNINV